MPCSHHPRCTPNFLGIPHICTCACKEVHVRVFWNLLRVPFLPWELRVSPERVEDSIHPLSPLGYLGPDFGLWKGGPAYTSWKPLLPDPSQRLLRPAPHPTHLTPASGPAQRPLTCWGTTRRSLARSPRGCAARAMPVPTTTTARTGGGAPGNTNTGQPWGARCRGWRGPSRGGSHCAHRDSQNSRVLGSSGTLLSWHEDVGPNLL